MTAYASVETALEATHAGAYDFLNKPLEMEALHLAVDRAIQHRRLRDEVKRLTEEVGHARTAGELVGKSPAMRKVYELIGRVSDTDSSVLLTGESGTGKHEGSCRRDGRFLERGRADAGLRQQHPAGGSG